MAVNVIVGCDDKAWSLYNILGWPRAVTYVEPVVAITPPPTPVMMVTYPFPFRRGVMGRVTLPLDLTAKEAARIGRFLEAIPL